jgi:hypothetical protein
MVRSALKCKYDYVTETNVEKNCLLRMRQRSHWSIVCCTMIDFYVGFLIEPVI